MQKNKKQIAGTARQLYSSLRAQQSAITSLGLSALSGNDLSALMQEAVQKLKKVLKVEYAKVLELLPDGRNMVFRAGAGWSKEVVINQTTVPTGKKSQAGYTLISRKPVIVKDFNAGKRFNGIPLLKKHGVRSGMSCIIWGTNNKPYGVLGVHCTQRRDFTQDDKALLQTVANILAAAISRKRAEKALRKSEEEFRTLADNISNLCWMAHADGWIYWYNSRWYEYTGTTFNDMKGWGWQSVHDPEILPLVMRKWKAAIASGKFFEMVFPLKGANGKFRMFLTRIVPMKDENGKVLQWFGTNTDIEDRENLIRQKDEFIGIASHELKTPLTSAKAYLQLMDELFREENNDSADDLLQGAQTNINRLALLIDSLLDVSRIQEGRMLYNFEEFKAKEMIESCCEQARFHNAKHKIVINGDLNAPVYGDKMRLGQVVDNLVSNAIKYSPDAEDVKVNISEKDGKLHVAVSDHGIGIPAEKLNRIFERFFRVEQAARQFQGLGLGLYISSEIINRHGGEIGVSSTVGKGSTFYFTIPVKPRNRKKPASKPHAPAQKR